MSRLIKGLASAAVVAGIGLAAQPVLAAPFITVNLLGRVQDPSVPSSQNPTPYTPTVTIAPGQTLEYAVEFQLAPAGTTNAFAGEPFSQTITDWNPSPGFGLNSLFFSLNQPALNPGIDVDFNAQFIAATTPVSPDPEDPDPASSSWAIGTGNSRGTITPRGDGNDNLMAVRLYRSSGNFDGIAANESPEVIRVGRGLAPVTGGGGPSTLNINLLGFPDNPQQPDPIVATYNWRDANGVSITYNQTLSEQLASVAGGDPIIQFNSLALVPEPATFGVLGTVGAIGLLARRRRVN
jgi:hypothetical protein